MKETLYYSLFYDKLSFSDVGTQPMTNEEMYLLKMNSPNWTIGCVPISDSGIQRIVERA